MPELDDSFDEAPYNDADFGDTTPPTPSLPPDFEDDDSTTSSPSAKKAATKAPTGTAGGGSTISDTITGVATTLYKKAIDNITARLTGVAASQPARQGASGRPVSDPNAAGNAITVNILGYPLPLKQGQLEKARAGLPFNLTGGQRATLAAAGIKVGLSATQNLFVSSTGQVVRQNANGQTVALSALRNAAAGTGTAGDDSTTLYFLLAAGAVAVFLFLK